MIVRKMVLMMVFCAVAVSIVEAVDLCRYEGLWVEVNPEEPFDRRTATVLSIYLIDGTVFFIATYMQDPGEAGIMQYQEGVLRFTDQHGSAEYRIDAARPDEMYRKGTSGSRQNEPIVRYERLGPQLLKEYAP